MPSPRGKRIALIAGTVAVIAIVVGIVASWGRLREEWYIWRLSSEDEEIRSHAAEVLVRMQSVRAVPTLIRLGKEKEGWPQVLFLFSERELAVSLDPLAYA